MDHWPVALSAITGVACARRKLKVLPTRPSPFLRRRNQHGTGPEPPSRELSIALRTIRPAALPAGSLPAAVGTRLHGVAAHLHGAPASGLVLGLVVEGPPARVVAARLEAPPSPLGHGRVDDRQEAGDRLLHSGGLGLEGGPANGAEAAPQPGGGWGP